MNTEKTGTFIAELRKEKGLTQAQLADRIHVSDKAISRWETGRGFPDINNLEALTECLGVSAAELLKGEKIPDAVSGEELQEITTDSISLAKEFFRRKKYVNILLGFILGLLIVSTAVIHISSPIYISDDQAALRIDELTDGRIVAVLDGSVTGYDLDRIEDQERGITQYFISCYQTQFGRLTGRRGETVVLIGDRSEVGEIYYYPSGGEDKLLYRGDGVTPYDGGVVTLPRLVYNYWLIIGALLSAAGIAAYLIMRRRSRTYIADTLLRIALVPVAFTISIPLCLLGRFDEVYNAAFYFSGIVLMTVVIYLILRIIVFRKKTQETE